MLARTGTLILTLGALLPLCLAPMGGALGAEDLRYRASADRPYEEVVEDVKFAIGGHNFRVTGGNDVGGAIGKRHQIDFPRSEIVHFCNLEYARKFLEAAPDYLLHMPCKVAVREHEGRVIVETQLLPQGPAETAGLTREVNDILKAIVDEATE